jgi:nitric oxide reductase subunit B
MAKKNFISYLLNPKNWWLPLLLIFTIGAAGVMMIGVHTYTEAPPIPSYVTGKNIVVFSNDEIMKGQGIFQKYALMEYGTMFGDGANRGPDFTAEALHQVTQYMNDYYQSHLQNDANIKLLRIGISEQVRIEIKTNTFIETNNTVKLSDAQAYAADELTKYYTLKFTKSSFPGAFKPTGYITSNEELKSLTAFFFWGAWVCGVERPGEQYSYTNNWPYDRQAGNTPTPAVILWSIIGSLALVIGLGLVLYYHGKLEKLDDNTYTSKTQPLMTRTEIEKFQPTAIQRATYKFFYAAILLFSVQVLAGILTVHDFVGLTKFWGFDLAKVLPFPVTRSWHVQLSLLWISACCDRKIRIQDFWQIRIQDKWQE